MRTLVILAALFTLAASPLTVATFLNSTLEVVTAKIAETCTSQGFPLIKVDEHQVQCNLGVGLMYGLEHHIPYQQQFAMRDVTIFNVYASGRDTRVQASTYTSLGQLPNDDTVESVLRLSGGRVE